MKRSPEGSFTTAKDFSPPRKGGRGVGVKICYSETNPIACVPSLHPGAYAARLACQSILPPFIIARKSRFRQDLFWRSFPDLEYWKNIAHSSRKNSVDLLSNVRLGTKFRSKPPDFFLHDRAVGRLAERCPERACAASVAELARSAGLPRLDYSSRVCRNGFIAQVKGVSSPAVFDADNTLSTVGRLPSTVDAYWGECQSVRPAIAAPVMSPLNR